MISLSDVSKWSKTTGWCLDCNGVDENEGTTQFIGLDEDACLKKCSENIEAKGCEHIATTCSVHTNKVSRGNGNARHNCWTAPNNCPGKPYYFIIALTLIHTICFLLEFFHL